MLEQRRCRAWVQDSQDPNPLIRALAVRTMGCIRVDKITEYLCDPLQRTLKVTMLSHACCANDFLICRPEFHSLVNAYSCKALDLVIGPIHAPQLQAQLSCGAQDDDPYVRKTAAMCVAKLHDINAELVEDRGFLDTLKVSLQQSIVLCTGCAFWGARVATQICPEQR